MSNMITVAIAGCGSRGNAYASYILKNSEKIKVVALADTIKRKVDLLAEKHNVAKEMCFGSVEEMLNKPKLADMMFICTQDRQHYIHAIPALKKGYDLLLEKPISPDLKECKEIADTANRLGRKVIVCHVLRYTRFYNTLKSIVDSGEIGEVITVNAEENVGYFHQAHSFVRGNWRNSTETSPMILAKSCHDMDILLWVVSKKCEKLSSFGSLKYFKKENAPKGSADRCFKCNLETKAKCPYDAEKIYLDGERGIRSGKICWPTNVLSTEPDEKNITEALKNGPYGRCVFRCDNNVVDHQVLNMQLEGGATLSFTMCAFSEKIGRTIKIRGTLGEIYGDMENNSIVVKKFQMNGEEPKCYDTSSEKGGHVGHGGGDGGLILTLIDYIGEGIMSDSITSIDRSVESHFVALAAEKSRVNGGEVIDIEKFKSEF